MPISLQRRQIFRVLALAATLAATGSQVLAQDAHDDAGNFRQGKLFMVSNAADGNVLQVYSRSADGPATLVTRVATGGTGSGAGLGSQGAVTLSSDGRYLFAVNAGSNSVSTFKLGRRGVELISTVPSGGERPVSVAESGGVVYVLNAPPAPGDTANGTGDANLLAGFRNVGGVLTPIPNSVRRLQAGSQPAQVSFDDDGDTLVVSERAANQLVSYSVSRNGSLSMSYGVTPSPGAVPFGFAVTKRNVVVVSEAGTSSASSYRIGGRKEPLLHLVTPALGNGQGAACWVSVTPDGRFAYTANAATSNISSYGIDRRGGLTLLESQAGFTTGNGALDMSVTPDGKQLHVFASRAPQQIVSFNIGSDGSLTRIGELSIGAGAGLVAN